jgi:hypothetical protein
MQTLYDWLCVAVFAGLILLFLQRSTAEVPRDKIVAYAPPAVGCALANYVGNGFSGVAAAIILAATLAYIWFVLKPLER